MKAVELFAGAGGLALGVAQAGFQHTLLVEYDGDACSTLRANAGLLGCASEAILESDSRLVNYSMFSPTDLVVGGPPCQPFSIGGKHHGRLDQRDMFPEAVRAVRETQPKAFLFENVKGLLRESFGPYFRYIVLQLRYPTILRHDGQSWLDHAACLESASQARVKPDLEYEVHARLLNAANYGVPQKRERVFIVGLRKDLGLRWSFPSPSHSRAALLYDQHQTGDYWRRHGIPGPERTGRRGHRNDSCQLSLAPAELAWRTVRDAICCLPPPEPSSPWA